MNQPLFSNTSVLSTSINEKHKLFFHLILTLIADNACEVWGTKCGETTNCLLYDTDKMRSYMFGFLAGCYSLGTLFDLGVVYHVGDLQIYDTDTDKETETEMETAKNDFVDVDLKENI